MAIVDAREYFLETMPDTVLANYSAILARGVPLRKFFTISSRKATKYTADHNGHKGMFVMLQSSKIPKPENEELDGRIAVKRLLC